MTRPWAKEIEQALSVRFAEYRDALGPPDSLSLHSLRHSYITHLIEDGYDPLFVQQQVGRVPRD